VTNLNLFDIVQRSEPRPDNVRDFETRSALPIVRIIKTKGGAFRELGRDDEGAVCPTGREFFLIELEDGQILREFSDGSIEPPTVATTSVLINDAIRHGVFVEVRS
jgi:hypothetical protein